MKEMEVVAAVIWRGELFLGMKRRAGTEHAGLWEFPGGKVEAGEELVAALWRELREELGIVPHLVNFWRTVYHEYAHARVRLHLFHVENFTGKVRAREGNMLAWLRPDDALLLPFLEADRPLVEALARDGR